jgi:DNA repair protein RecN (Recombination protein N)
LLTRIQIQGLAIIDALDIGFSSGFNVITGETGAGKSILIKALGILLGGKATSDHVRKGCTAANVSGTFSLPASHVTHEVLEEIGIPLEYYDSKSKKRFDIIVRRSISAKGRSSAWINDIPVTLGKLKEFAERLIDIFAQHENHRLLDPHLHTLYVDQFLTSDKTSAEVKELHSLLMQDLAKLDTLVTTFRERQRDADYLRFRHAEFSEFDPSVEDYEKTKQVCEAAHSHLSISEALTSAITSIDSGANGETLSSILWDVAKQLDTIGRTSPEFVKLADQAREVAQNIDDLSFNLGKSFDAIDMDEEDIEAAQKRLSGYQELMRKLATRDAEDLVAELDRLSLDLDFLDSASLEVTKLLGTMSKRAQSLRAADAKLVKERTKASAKLKKALDQELHDLAMPGASLSVRFETVQRTLAAPDLHLFGEEAEALGADVFETLSEVSSQGSQQARFFLGSNKGEGESALHKIASGGEISRIMLGFKRALSAGADTAILVFDEIDTGISGRVADVVGHKLCDLAQGFQIICISHLPQVAAYADTHFRVAKVAKGGRTESTIEKLTDKESQDEIARLLSGDEVTKSSKANAKQLIAKARARATV